MDPVTARATFDRGRDNTHPCTFCARAAKPTHRLRHIGRYPNGNLLTRPVCDHCETLADHLEEQLKAQDRYGVLAQIGESVYAMRLRLGFYPEKFKAPNRAPYFLASRIAHAQSELGEAFQCLQRGDFELRYEDGKPEGMPVELGDALMIVCEVAHFIQAPLGRAIAEKTSYNKSRPPLNGGKLI
jgi:NTP pyrophosphatase (non-canonical NTP hydrolase)